jgi:DNA-binding transcriptional LysR family regulator
LFFKTIERDQAMSSGPLFQSLRRLACFAAIADAGSIKGGAKRLGLTVPVVSTALSELEEEPAVVLAVRTTRKLELTTAGEEVYANAQQMLASADTALAVSKNERVTNGDLRITVPVELASNWLPAYLYRFHQAYPGIKLTADAEDTVVPLSGSEYDIAIQANYHAPNQTPDTTLVKSAIAMGRVNLVCVAAKKPRVRWQGSTTIMNNSLLEMKHRGDSLLAVEKKTSNTVHIKGSGLIKTNNHETALAFAREGLGVVMVMEPSVTQDIANKNLTRVFQTYNFGHLNLELKLRDSLPSPPARAFVNFMKSEAKV